MVTTHQISILVSCPSLDFRFKSVLLYLSFLLPPLLVQDIYNGFQSYATFTSFCARSWLVPLFGTFLPHSVSLLVDLFSLFKSNSKCVLKRPFLEIFFFKVIIGFILFLDSPVHQDRCSMRTWTLSVQFALSPVSNNMLGT